MKDLARHKRILIDAATKTPPGAHYTDEDRREYDKASAVVAEQKARGVDTQIPHEWVELDDNDLADIKAMQAKLK
jgi:hypothetical protein